LWVRTCERQLSGPGGGRGGQLLRAFHLFLKFVFGGLAVVVVWLLSLLLLLLGGGSDGWVLLIESALCGGGGVENGLRIRHDVKGFGLIGGDRLVKQEDLASTGAGGQAGTK
jgi:hypothetical protein